MDMETSSVCLTFTQRGYQKDCVNELSKLDGIRSSKRIAKAFKARPQLGIGIVHFCWMFWSAR